MDFSRLLFRFLVRTERLLDRLNSLLTFLYVTVVIVLTSAISIVYVQIIHPLIYHSLHRPSAHLHTTISLYLLLTVIINYTRCLTTSAGSPPRISDPEAAAAATTASKSIVDGVESHRTRSETWRYCTICRSAKPPRAHHCTPCGACFEKLCHHCPAFGRCVGRDNLPFFFRFVVTTWWGSLFAAATCAYLRKTTSDRLTPLMDDVLFFTAVAGCAVGVAVGVLGTWHVYLMLTGQTTIEWLENLEARRRGNAPAEWGMWSGPFSKGLRENIRQAFGELSYRYVPWWAVLLVPVSRSLAGEMYIPVV